MPDSSPVATATPAAPSRWVARVDPEGRARRNALRGLLCTAIAFVGYGLAGATVWVPWAFIGVLNTLLPDFSGPFRPRLRTGIEVLAGTAAAVFLGAVAARSPVVLTLAMFAVAFVAVYVGVCSPYLAAAGTSILLAFLLSAGTPAGAGDAAWRALSSAIGSGLAVGALLWVLPLHRRRRLEPALAAACRAVARLLVAPTTAAAGRDGAPPDGAEAAARDAMEEVLRTLGAMRWPPLSSSAVDQARLAFLHDLQAAFARAVALHHTRGRVGLSAEVERVLADAAGGLEELADWLVDAGPGPDGAALADARERALRLEVDAREAAVRRDADLDDFVRFRSARRARAAVQLVTDIAAGVGAAAFHTETPRPIRPGGLADVTGGLATYPERLAHSFSSGSMVFRHAVRLGAACALAVAVEQALDLRHGYWAVLTVVVTLRTTLGASARRSLDRLLGTVLGLGVAVGLIALAQVSGHRVLVIELATLAGVTATLFTGAATLRWAWSVTAVTATVLVLFQLVEPGDWSLAPDRAVATAVGIAVALVAAVVFWPAGSVPALRRALGRSAGAVADHLDAVVRAATGDPGATTRLASTRVASVRVLSQTRSTLAAAHREGGDGLVRLSIAVVELEQVGEFARRIDAGLSGTFTVVAEPAARRALRRAGDAVVGALGALGPEWPGPSSPVPPRAGDVVDLAWQDLSPDGPAGRPVLDALADLGSMAHRVDELGALARAPVNSV